MATPTALHLSPEISRLDIKNLGETSLLGNLFGRVVQVVVDKTDPEVQGLLKIVFGIFAALSLVLGVLSLPFGLTHSLSLMALGGIAGLGVAVTWLSPCPNRGSDDKKECTDAEFQKACDQATILTDRPGSLFDSWKISKIEISLEKALNAKTEEEKREVLNALNEPIMTIDEGKGVIARYTEHTLYKAEAMGWKVVGQVKEKYLVVYKKDGKYADTENFFFLEDGKFYEPQVVDFFSKKMSAVPGKNKILQIPAA